MLHVTDYLKKLYYEINHSHMEHKLAGPEILRFDQNNVYALKKVK